MNVLKIAIRSIQHRGLGSILTIFSMALGVMLVVSVLTMHGVVSRSFKSNSNFPYDIIVAASGSSMQVTMNTVFYLSSPVENIPYEYYLAFGDRESRQRELKHSISYSSMQSRQHASELAAQLAAQAAPSMGFSLLANHALQSSAEQIQLTRMGYFKSGKLEYLTEVAIPVNLGDYLGDEGKFRVVGTKPAFFDEIVLDMETREKMTFAKGRAFEEFSAENGFFEAVLGANVAREMGVTIGDQVSPIHGDPSGHTHEQTFTVVGILDKTGLPHDRAAFVNLEGFYLMEDHAKPVDEAGLAQSVEPPAPAKNSSMLSPVSWTQSDERADEENIESVDANLFRTPLPIEQREVTAILVRSYAEEEEDENEEGEEDPFASIGGSFVLASAVDGGFLESELEWTDFRPARAKEEVQAVFPVKEVTVLFEYFVNPIRWILLTLTIMICLVSGISILVGIYNSMSQRRHEIAVMRALGASRSKVMVITLMESITLALVGGMIGWVAGHLLNVAASPFVEAQTGVTIGFWDFAPSVPILSILGSSGIPLINPDNLEWVKISPELLLIPGLILLAVIVGVYPAISAYRTDVAESLGS